MCKKLTAIILLLFSLCGTTSAQFDTILNRYRHYLFNSTEPEGDIKQLMSSMTLRKQWDDINYNDIEKANWQPLIHLKRVRDLALVWSDPKSAYYQKQEVKSIIDAGLDHWLEKRYKSTNWWHNEIGVPQCMRDIIVLLRGKITGDQLSRSMQVLAQHRVQYNGVGANLTWSADLGFYYGILTNDLLLMQKCRDLALKEIRITTGEGVQPDLSFHQHDKRLQMYQYGRAFLWDNTRLAWELHGTTLAFPDDKIKILTDFVLEGWQWMARGIHTVPGTMDRSASRIDALQSADIRKLIPYLIEIRPDKAAAFEEVERRQNGNGSLKGFRYYPYSDFAAYHHKDFSFFLKTLSSRTLPSESINNENLKGRLMNSGDAYLVKNGDEYFNLMPVWDWQRLPGVTGFDGAHSIDRKPFAGSVSDSHLGMSAMEYLLRDKEQKRTVTARKFWANYQNIVICLIGGLDTKDLNEQVYTTLDQCRWTGEVIVNKPRNKVKEGSWHLDGVKWIYHSGIAYVPLSTAKIELKLKSVSGTWKSINNSLTDRTITDKIFLPVLIHNRSDSDQSTGYVLASCTSPKKAESLAKHPVWNILQNDKDCQAVLFSDGTLMASFYKAGSIKFGKNRKLEVDRPCLVLFTNKKLYASDPLHKGGELTVRLENKVILFNLPGNGSSIEGILIQTDSQETVSSNRNEFGIGAMAASNQTG